MSLIKYINRKTDLIIYILLINVFIFSTLYLSFISINNKLYAWIISIFLLNIQTLLFCSMISWQFYNKQCIYTYYLSSIIITALFSSILMWAFLYKFVVDIPLLIIIFISTQLASTLDLFIYNQIHRTYINHKKRV
jgi:hypothetical protein